MPRTKFPVEILTPEGEVFNDEIEMLSTRTATGSIGILAKHTPLLAMLDPTELRLYRAENDVERFAQGEGYLQVAADGSVLLLVEEARRPQELDVATLQERLRKAQEHLARTEPNTEEQRVCAGDVRRWETFLGIAQGGG